LFYGKFIGLYFVVRCRNCYPLGVVFYGYPLGISHKYDCQKPRRSIKGIAKHQRNTSQIFKMNKEQRIIVRETRKKITTRFPPPWKFRFVCTNDVFNIFILAAPYEYITTEEPETGERTRHGGKKNPKGEGYIFSPGVKLKYDYDDYFGYAAYFEAGLDKKTRELNRGYMQDRIQADIENRGWENYSGDGETGQTGEFFGHWEPDEPEREEPEEPEGN
jgi:hypothetical protein